MISHQTGTSAWTTVMDSLSLRRLPNPQKRQGQFEMAPERTSRVKENPPDLLTICKSWEIVNYITIKHRYALHFILRFCISSLGRNQVTRRGRVLYADYDIVLQKQDSDRIRSSFT
jgi:hypothetical protein